MNIDELALKVGATHYSPAPMRAVKGWSFTFEQLQALIAEYEAAGSEPVARVVKQIAHEKVEAWVYAPISTGAALYAKPPRVAELEAEVVAQKAEWNKAYDIGMLAKHKIAELEAENATLQKELSFLRPMKPDYLRLAEENAALLVAIEVKDAALDSSVSWIDDWAETSDTDFPRVEAQVNAARALSPSTELLEARDRKRDAELLRVVLNKADWSPNQLVYANGYIEDLAKQRESGEWKPEL